ncbi:MAG TPA: HAMP domain-containing sensor histidine kinase [Solirubrobacteraceae bacterium]|nr:HAMP domain-containing sensor histidine kinase [Solirubrobacteraceae bacterium]
MRLPRPSIRLRLTAWYATIFIAMGAVLLAISYGVVRHEFRDEQGKVHVEEVTTAVRGGAPSYRLKIAPGLPTENTTQVRTLSREEREAYVRARNAYAAQVHAANDRALRRVLLAFGGALLLVTFASVAAGWIVAGRALRPISRITSTARSISDRTLDARIALQGPRDELRELADTFDSMLERLEAAFESQRRFVANASHELRTPLAIVRTELDVTLDDPDADAGELRAMAHVVQDANERMERLIASLLALASSEGGIAQSRPADLAQIVRPALEREAFSDGTLQLEASLAPAPVLGDPVLLERLAENLVENAVRYNAAVGWVRVRTGVQRGEAVLEVANPGARIDPADVEGLLEPFRRLESSRARSTGGYGLGLAVVRAVAQAHGGRVAVLARREGGLEVTVSLPLAAADAAEPVVTAPARA